MDKKWIVLVSVFILALVGVMIVSIREARKVPLGNATNTPEIANFSVPDGIYQAGDRILVVTQGREAYVEITVSFDENNFAGIYDSTDFMTEDVEIYSLELLDASKSTSWQVIDSSNILFNGVKLDINPIEFDHVAVIDGNLWLVKNSTLTVIADMSVFEEHSGFMIYRSSVLH